MMIKIECLGARYQDEIMSNRYLVAICSETGGRLMYRDVYRGRKRTSVRMLGNFKDNYLLKSPMANGKGYDFDILSARNIGLAMRQADEILERRNRDSKQVTAIAPGDYRQAGVFDD